MSRQLTGSKGLVRSCYLRLGPLDVRGRLTESMGLFISMFGNILFLDDVGALQAEPIGSKRAGDGVIAYALADLRHDRDVVINGAQNGLVMLDAGICRFLALIQKALHMFCSLCVSICLRIFLHLAASQRQRGRTTTKHGAALNGWIDLDILGRSRRLRARRHFGHFLVGLSTECRLLLAELGGLVVCRETLWKKYSFARAGRWEWNAPGRGESFRADEKLRFAMACRERTSEMSRPATGIERNSEHQRRADMVVQMDGSKGGWPDGRSTCTTQRTGCASRHCSTPATSQPTAPPGCRLCAGSGPRLTRRTSMSADRTVRGRRH